MDGLPWAGRMIDQNAFDDVADALVAAGVRVTYESLEQAFRERDRATSGETYGKAHSRRDIQDPFDNWKRRRRYKPHFSAIELPEPAERAIAKAFAALQAAAGHLPTGFLPPEPSASGADLQARIEELADGMGRRFDELAAENAALRRDVAALARQGGQAGGRVMRKGRKSGVPYATSIFFWDYLIRQLRDAIRERGPMTAAELLALVDEDTHTLAAAAFEEIDETTLREKLAERVKRGRYLKQVGERYEVLRRRRSASKDDHRPEEDDGLTD